MVSARYLDRTMQKKVSVRLLGGGEGSGPLYPPPILDEEMISCEEA
jgi:hypothetical protein